ncbi:fungal-specific transcription factor domain-containing protein [Ilyonectria sp. MPI-CAGE-AT-0026]|nr:fungal-specific transcription factor domain-containing protein [Ilyonectria sp. MPI-CAGE-AT-0026]
MLVMGGHHPAPAGSVPVQEHSWLASTAKNGNRNVITRSHHVRTANVLALVNDKKKTSVLCRPAHSITACLVEDPVTRRHQSRNYVETLESRVAFLENLLQRTGLENIAPPAEAPITENTPSDVLPTASWTKDGDNDGDDDDDSASELSSKVGILGLTVDGEEPHYLGSSSAFSFSRVIHSSLRRPFPRSFESLIVHQDDKAAPSPCLLPEYELGISLSNAYFENVHPQYPFLHEPTFRRWENALFRPSDSIEDLNFDPVPLFFVNMIYAVGALLLSNSGSLPEQLYVSAQLYIDDILSRNNLEAIQAILCYTMYSLRSSRGPSIWKLSGLALRQCIELGYHRSVNRFGPTTDPLRLEMRKRAFWCAFGIDCVAALTLGRPLGIHVQEVDAEFPLDIDDSNITEAEIIGEPRSPGSDYSTTMTTALHVFRLRHIWARLHASLFSDVKSNMDDMARDRQISIFRAEIDAWLASTPPIPTRTGPALSIFATQNWHDLEYDETILMLYRGQLTGHRGDVNDEIFMQCTHAAERICVGYRRLYVGKPVNCTWGTLHVIFFAGLTYLHCLWTSAAVCHETSLDDMSSALTSCTMVLTVVAERFKNAAPYRDICEALCNRTRRMMSDRGDETSTLQRQATGPNDTDSVNFTQWMAEISGEGMSDAVSNLLTGLVSEFVGQDEGAGEPR